MDIHRTVYKQCKLRYDTILGHWTRLKQRATGAIQPSRTISSLIYAQTKLKFMFAM